MGLLTFVYLTTKQTTQIRERQSQMSMRQSQIAHSTRSSNSPKKMATSVPASGGEVPLNVLLDEIKTDIRANKALIALKEIERRLVGQERQMEELKRYKEKWRNLKRDARKNASAIRSTPISREDSGHYDPEKTNGDQGVKK